MRSASTDTDSSTGVSAATLLIRYSLSATSTAPSVWNVDISNALIDARISGLTAGSAPSPAPSTDTSNSDEDMLSVDDAASSAGVATSDSFLKVNAITPIRNPTPSVAVSISPPAISFFTTPLAMSSTLKQIVFPLNLLVTVTALLMPSSASASTEVDAYDRRASVSLSGPAGTLSLMSLLGARLTSEKTTSSSPWIAPTYGDTGTLNFTTPLSNY